MRNTTGEAAFDAATRQRLEVLRKNPVDCFGQRISLERSRNPLVIALARHGPQRATLLAARLSIPRVEVDTKLDAMVRTGFALCDTDGFYSLSEEAYGP